MQNVPNDENQAVQARFGVLGTMLAEQIQVAYDRMLDGAIDPVDRHDAAVECKTLSRVRTWAAIA